MTRARVIRETSAGGVVYRMADGRPLFLLIRDSYANWGFPKGHLEGDERPERAAEREVAEETGIGALEVQAPLGTIEWHFRFRGRLVHKVCHFFLMESASSLTSPQREEGITACEWLPFDEAVQRLSYANARGVLERAGAIATERAAR